MIPTPQLLALALVSLVLSALITALVRRAAVRMGLLDRPNPRSSHIEPTPRGGGIAIVLVSFAALVFVTLHGELDQRITLPLACGGLLIACVGFVDDRISLSPHLRLVAQGVAALGGLYLLGGLPPLQFRSVLVDPGLIGVVVAVLATVWMINLYNFMDGIDGMAAAEAAFVTIAGGAICVDTGTIGLAAVSFGVGGACLGFLIWNWQPASIFMGDVGSGFLGFIIAVLALASAYDDPARIFVWLVLSGTFVVDATTTLVRRFLRRERVYEAHRTHAYQWLSRRWHSHARVTLLYLAINLGWLLPLALYANRRPELSTWIAVAALFPLVVLAIAAGSGRPESPASDTGENQSSG